MIEKQLKSISKVLMQQKKYLTTAESCTGGLVAKLITDIPGSSSWFERGLITYSNQAKMDLLFVQQQSLDEYGAVSEEIAKEMASGCVKFSPAHYGLGITGIAGPDGGSAEKPVGMVCFGWAKSNPKEACEKTADEIIVHTDTQYFSGDRATIRQLAAQHAIQELLKFIS